MRRSSNARLQSQTSEPLIVVEDSNPSEDEAAKNPGSSQDSSEDESPTMNPYLLSPYSRDVRKHSLPTPQCSGITASQVRRLSERGETVGPGPRQTEFLATLSTAPQPTPGGRRHSVVTISRVPPALFGRNRRESVAAFPSGGGFPARILSNRRESIACPPSEPRGSVHNLQLDIMDDIVQARKVRMKLWNTSNERVCEVADESGGVQRYTNSGRRFSDFVGTTLAPIPSSHKRRASEMPPPQPPTSTASKTGIVCSNTDLISILSSLSTSATEINQCEEKPRRPPPLKSHRSNSFDVSTLAPTPDSWFQKRHQPKPPEEAPKVLWDNRSGSMVDPHALGSAIEGFLKKASPEAVTTQSLSPRKASPKKSSWFSKNEEDGAETCDSSLCATLKDLFVK